MLEGDFDLAIELCKNEFVPKAYSSPVGIFHLGEFASDCMDKTCNLHRWQELKPGDLHVAITNLPFFNAEKATEFQSQDDLKSCLLASASAWPFAALVHRRGIWCVDGGLSDFQPVVDEDTITVSPFYFSDADIKPSRYVPLWWSFIPPRSEDTIDWLYSLGYEDCVTYLEKNVSGFVNLEKMARNPHSYDVRSSAKSAIGSVNRFLGYNTSELTDSLYGTKLVSYFFDFLLLIFLVVVWKPFALVCIYAEVFIWAGVYLVTSLAVEVYELYPIISLGMVNHLYRYPMYCMLASTMLLLVKFYFPKGFFAPDLSLICALTSVILLQKISLLGFSKYNKSIQFWECVSCLWSVSLLMRFLTGGPSSATLRKHDKLARNSMVYRIFRHMI